APRWRAERVGNVRDIEAWVPLADGEQPSSPGSMAAAAEAETVTGIVTPFRLEYKRSAGQATTSYLNGLAQKKIIGGRAASSNEVYAASRGTDPKSGEPTTIQVEVQDRGTIVTFCVVNIPGLSEL